jgi:ABC-type multidrug transport system ATPase subunit
MPTLALLTVVDADRSVFCLRLQHDNLVPTMTSWESLSFYAGIILPPQTSAEKKRKRILEVLELMGLAHARDTLVRSAAKPFLPLLLFLIE